MPNTLAKDTTAADIAGLTRRLTRLENSPQIGNTSILSGALQILNQAGDVVAAFGYLTDGTIGLGIYDPATGVRQICLGQTPGESSLYALSVLNSSGTLQQVAGAVGASATALQNVTGTGTASPVSFSDGPSVTAVVGPSGEAQIGIGASVYSPGPEGYVELAVDGAVWMVPTTVTPMLSVFATGSGTAFGTALITGLSPGAHVFGHMYAVNGTGTVSFFSRSLVVQPL